MKKTSIATLALATMILGGTGLTAPNAAAATFGYGGMHFRRHIERHPELKKAMKALMNSRKFLLSAADDFGGHKAAAIKAIDQAISEVKAANAFDRH